jgi:hypothetical protein
MSGDLNLVQGFLSTVCNIDYLKRSWIYISPRWRKIISLCVWSWLASNPANMEITRSSGGVNTPHQKKITKNHDFSGFLVIFARLLWWNIGGRRRFHRNSNGAPDPRGPGQTRVLLKFRQPVDPVHTLKTVKGLLHLVPSRTPRNSGYGVLCTWGLCYMLFLLYV